MTKVIISNFEEKEYNLSSFGLDGFLIIEENITYIQDRNDDYYLFYDDIKNPHFVNEDQELLPLTDELREIIRQIILSQAEEEIDEEIEDVGEISEVIDEMSEL